MSYLSIFFDELTARLAYLVKLAARPTDYYRLAQQTFKRILAGGIGERAPVGIGRRLIADAVSYQTRNAAG
jgi:hypothetical protein